jgi:hypothetical protein
MAMSATTTALPKIARNTIGFLPVRSASNPHSGADKNMAIPQIPSAIPAQNAACE